MRGKRRFLFGAWLVSGLFSCGAACAMDPYRWIPAMLPWQRMIWSGLFLLTICCAGFMGMRISLLLSRQYRIRFPRLWVATFLLSALLIFGTGVLGQFLFMRSVPEPIVYEPLTEIVLLVDSSRSMGPEEHGYSTVCKDAACQFVDSLDENVNMQIIPFASLVDDVSQMTTLDAPGKTAVKDFINSIDMTGGTDFNNPLRDALQTISREGRPDSGKAVILLTDGESDFQEEFITQYQNAQIHLFVIRFCDDAAETNERVDKLITFANETDGAYVPLVPDQNNQVDAAAIFTAFRNAFSTVIEELISTPSGLLLDEREVSVYQQVIRYATLVICALLFETAYYGNLRVVQAAVNVLMAVLLGTLIPLIPKEAGYLPCAGLAGLLLGSSLVVLRVEEGGTISDG